MKPKTVLVTGGAGFIGSSFVQLMVTRGHRVVVLDKLTYCGNPENLKEPIATGLCELVVGDIGNMDLVRTLLRTHKPAGVFNFAAESHVDNSISGPQAFIQTNIVGTSVLLEAVRSLWTEWDAEHKAQFRFVHVSTDEVFGQLGPEGYFTEDSRYQPNSPYSASKAGSDHLVSAWNHTYKLPTLITNCSNNYGPRQYPEKLIPVVISSALAGKPIPVYGRGQNVRDWIHVEDHCRGIELAFLKGKTGASYCFGGRAERRNIDLVNTICQILEELTPKVNGGKYAEQIHFVEDRPGHDFRYAIDDSKACDELGYTRQFKFEDGLRQTVRWYLDNPSWLRPSKTPG